MTKLQHIFNSQANLMMRYKVGIGHDIELQSTQDLARYYSWFVVEEIAETMEAWLTGRRKDMYEEMSDVLHFLVEVCVICGLEPAKVPSLIDPEFDDPSVDPLDFLFRRTFPHEPAVGEWIHVIESLGNAMRHLKNKPWKEQKTPVNIPDLHRCLALALYQYIVVCVAFKLNADQVYQLYFDKHSVNHERLDSHY